LLRNDLIAQLQLDQVGRNAHLVDGRPPQCWLYRKTIIAEDACASKLAHVKAFVGQFFDCQAPPSLAQ
jgi:hypothetical protein